MQLDVATDVYPVRAGEKFNIVLAPTLNLDGTPDTGYYTQVINLSIFVEFASCNLNFNDIHRCNTAPR
jgi:hypothetical protein